MYVTRNGDVQSDFYSYSQFRKFVASMRGFDAGKHLDTIYKWYRDDHALIADRPTKIIINRGQHFFDNLEDYYG